MGRDKGIMRGEGFEFILCGFKRQACVIGDFFGEAFGKPGLGIEACADSGCADSGAALRERIEFCEAALDAFNAEIDLRDIAREFLAERNGRRVLCVGAANFDDFLKALGFIV